MRLDDSLLILRNNWRFIVFAIIIAMVISGLCSHFVISKTYISSVTVLISAYIDNQVADPILPYPLILDKNIAKVYGILAKSNAVIAEVIADLNLPAHISQLKSKTSVNPVGELGLLQISVEYTDPYTAEEIVNKIIDYLRVEASKTGLLNKIYVIDSYTPLLPAKPNLILNIILAFVTSAVASIMYVFIKNYMDDSVKHCEEVKTRLNLCLLGAIPFYPKLKNLHVNQHILTGNGRFKVNLVAARNSNSQAKEAKQLKTSADAKSHLPMQNIKHVIEAYKALRTNVQYVADAKAFKVFLITSPDISEGKTNIAVNLSVSLSQTNNKVLLIDCNFRAPALHTFFNCSNSKGLTDFLTGKANVERNMFLNKRNFTFLKSGPQIKNPSEMLESDRFKDFINNARSNFDIVIIDSPSAVNFADASILSRLCDATILTVCIAKTKYAMIYKALENLNNVGANIIGVVVNNVRTSNKEL